MFVAGAGVGAALFCLEPEPVQESAPGPWASVAGVGAAQKKGYIIKLDGLGSVRLVISSIWMARAPYDWLYHQIGWLGLRTTSYIIELDGSGSKRLVISYN